MKKLLLVTLVASAMILPASGKAPGNTAKAPVANASGAPTYQQLLSFGAPSLGSSPQGQIVRGTDAWLYGTTVNGGRNDYGTVFRLKPDGTGFSLLEEFDEFTTGGFPYAGLIQGTDGALYGTTSEGGSSGYGTVFKLNPDGTGFTVLKSFDDTTSGSLLFAGLMQGTDGALYGTAKSGGSGGYGTVFRLNPDGSGFTVLQDLDNDTTGGYPDAVLVQGTDGALYGTAAEGGSLGYGTAFKLNPNGSGFTVLLNFDDATTGSHPYGSLMQGTDGALYGTAFYGGNASFGTVFRLNRDGSGFTVLKNFDNLSTGMGLYAGLMQGTDGALYGTTTQGGSGEWGTVFRLNPDGTNFAVLQNFDDVTTGGVLFAGLVQGPDGTLYGTAVEGGSLGFGTVFRVNPDGSGFAVLNNFPPYPNVLESGGSPTAGLIQGTDGALYGTAVYGGNGGDAGYGTVFKLNPDGTGYTVLHNFDFFTTGGYPYAELIQGTDGALYGTASAYGSNSAGTVFRVNPDGSAFTVLKDLDYDTTGGYPYAGLIQGTDGALYGTATQGGSLGSGTVFRDNPDGSGFTVLKNLDNVATGGYPIAGLIQGTDGALYGTAESGGSFTYGTVFKLNPDGSGFTVLQNFDDTTGRFPHGRLIQGMDGALYGTAYYGGGPGGVGTVFTLNPDGTDFTVLHGFDDLTTGGGEIYAGLTQGPDGVLYGTATAGGSNGYGTVFKLNPDGTGFDVLLNLDNVTTGGEPDGNLMWGADGNLYGTAFRGGDFGGGTLFRLLFNPCSGKADGTACDDGNPCTFSDSCMGGGTGTPVCTGTSVNCDDGIACTIDSCDVFTGACVNLSGAEVPDVQFTNATTINWPTIAGATSYNTYRGTILQSGLGSRPTAAPHYDHTCFEAGDILGDGLTVSTDPAVPPVDTAFYYQVSEVTSCGEGPIGTDSNGSLIPNTNPCLVP